MTNQQMTVADPSATQMQTAPARVSLIANMATRYGMDPQAFQSVIRATVMPSGATNDQMAAFLLVANRYDLDPITREIYAFPARGGGVTPVVGIDGWIRLAQSRPEFDGMSFEFADDANGKCSSCRCTLWRKDRTRPIEITEYMGECARGTDPWKSHPRRMLRHKAAIQAIRYAFGFSGVHDEDDAEVIYSSPAAAPARTAAADLTARLAEPIEHVQASPSDVPAWPQANDDGELVDIRGCPWIESAHSANRTCTDSGEWRRKRGADPSVIERLEQEAMVNAAPDEAPAAEAADQDASVTEGASGAVDWEAI